MIKLSTCAFDSSRSKYWSAIRTHSVSLVSARVKDGPTAAKAMITGRRWIGATFDISVLDVSNAVYD